jgi:sugar PTS system EIIA component
MVTAYAKTQTSTAVAFPIFYKERKSKNKKGMNTMFKKWFGKKEKPTHEDVVAPLAGAIKPLEEVPDPVFAQKMMGDGIAIEPTDGEVVAPVDGEVVQVFPTKHAVGLRSEAGVELLIHVGLETVSMSGEGFTAHVKAGDRVKKGQRLLTVDFGLVQQKAKSTITPIIVTNGDIVASLEKTSETTAVKGETVLFRIETKA